MQSYRKVQVYFEKSGESRFLSHLDLARTMERAIRRSGLPARFTEGMNPRVKISFSTALPLGMESRLEAMLIQVEAGTAIREAVEKLAGELPEGLRPFDADELFTGEKWHVARIHYEIRPGEEDLPAAEEVDALLERESVMVERRSKQVDIRPLLDEFGGGGEVLRLAIAWTDSGTARPEDVLRALGRDPDGVRVVKVGTTFRTSYGEMIRKVHGSADTDQPR